MVRGYTQVVTTNSKHLTLKILQPIPQETTDHFQLNYILCEWIPSPIVSYPSLLTGTSLE